MKNFFYNSIFTSILIFVVALCFMGGCDSGEKAIDELTGKRAVKQYQKSKKDIEKIADKQEERYKKIPDDNDEN